MQKYGIFDTSFVASDFKSDASVSLQQQSIGAVKYVKELSWVLYEYMPEDVWPKIMLESPAFINCIYFKATD